MGSFVVAHISDFHFRAGSSVFRLGGQLEIIEELARILHCWKDQLSVLLISGDLAHTGDRKDIQEVVQFLTADTDSIPWLSKNKRNSSISFLADKLSVIPGNHDRFRPGWRPRGTVDELLEGFWSEGVGGVQKKHIAAPNGESLYVISADFTLARTRDAKGRFGFMGQGRVYPDRLEKLKEISRGVKTDYPNTAIMWMVHFAPEFESVAPIKPKLRFLDGNKLIEATDEIGVDYVFCGHTHIPLCYQPPGSHNTWVLCAGSASCQSRYASPSIHLFEFNISQGLVLSVRHQDFFWNRQTFERA